jgi:HEAT repeat protein
MDATYTYACGVVWCLVGEQEAGWELVRALDSKDRDIRQIATAALCEAGPQSIELIGSGLSTKQITLDQATQCLRELTRYFPLATLGPTN